MFNSKSIPSKRRTRIDRDFILSRVSEESILQRYLGISVVYDRLFKSPLRDNDNRPSCQFRQTYNGIYLKDFSGDFYGDCFDVVKRKHGVNYDKALRIIAQDFGLTDDTPIQYNVLEKDVTLLEEQRKKVFQIKARQWTRGDKEFWTRFYIKRTTLKKFNVQPVQILWIDGEIRYQYDPKDPAYAYYFGNGNWKIYFPYRDGKTKPRFYSNGPHIQGWRELDLATATEIIITKSLKDVMVLDLLGFNAIAPPAEGALVDPEVIEMLRNIPLYILFDNDDAGMKWGQNNSDEYGIPFIYLPGEEKDTSDYIEAHGPDATRKLIVQLLN